MKLSVEVDNEKFSFSYEIGKDKQHYETPIFTEAMIAFAKLLECCHSVAECGSRKNRERIFAEAMEKEKKG